RRRGVHRQLFRQALGGARGLCRALSDPFRRQRDDAAPDSARRAGPARADRAGLEVLPCPEGAGEDRGARNLPPLHAPLLRARSRAGVHAAQPRMVREVDPDGKAAVIGLAPAIFLAAASVLAGPVEPSPASGTFADRKVHFEVQGAYSFWDKSSGPDDDPVI